MKLLFNQNLSYRLPARLADLFPDSAHVRPLGLAQISDDLIREILRRGAILIFELQGSPAVSYLELFKRPTESGA